jgi:pimeloyl-ACP methyl ester carboxylesterase
MSHGIPRRLTLLGGATALGAFAAGCAAPAPGTTGVDHVLVHGAWHSSACWADVVPVLSGQGTRALAIDLPGAGVHARLPAAYLAEGQRGLADEPSPLRDLTLRETADVVVEVLRGLRSEGSGRRTVLVGHSLAGPAITLAAESAPELVDHLVYVAALVPTALGSAAAYLALPEAGPRYPFLYVGDPAVIGATRINPRSPDPEYRALLHRTFYGDVDEERFLAYAAGLTPDNPVGIARATVGATAQRWGSIPRTYVLTTQDRVVNPAVQQRMIDDADRLAPGTRFRVVRIGSSHSPFASRPRDLARILREAGR